MSQVKKLVEHCDEIEQILASAAEYDLEQEVEALAKELIEEGIDPITAYEVAFGEWVK